MRTFILSNAPEQFESIRNKPTRHQTRIDKEARALAREEARKILRRTWYDSDALAIKLAAQGFGVDDIYARTGIDRRILQRLVLGE